MSSSRLRISPGFRVSELNAEGERTSTPCSELQLQVAQTREKAIACSNCLVGVEVARSAQFIASLVALYAQKCAVCLANEARCSFSLSAGAQLSQVCSEVQLLSRAQSDEQSSVLPPEGEWSHFAYRITTSGTTGARKVVDVPWTSILPNIHDFIRILEVTADDVVLFSTSCFFDPSIVEIFLPIMAGCELAIVADSVRSDRLQFVHAFLSLRPTIVQLTPAVLRRLGSVILRTVLFSETSSLRVLLVGGEEFPIDLLSVHIQNSIGRIRVFNVYGITEVSCWSSLMEVKSGDSTITVGEPLSGIQFRVEDGVLQIGGSRNCFVDGVKSEFISTGDLCEQYGDSFIVRGRVDDQVKINGIRVNLESLALSVRSRYEVDAKLILYEQIFLVLFVTRREQLDFSDLFPALLRPAKVITLQHMPVNQNGKIDKLALMECIGDLMASTNKADRFWDVCAKCGITRKVLRTEQTFRDFGVDSLLAAEIAFSLGSADALPHIVLGSTTIASFVHLFVESEQRTKNAADSLVAAANLRDATLEWSYDMEKCIDGNPKIISVEDASCVVVASHAGHIACLEVSRGAALWSARLPDRIESTLAVSAEFIVAGCHDSRVYFFDYKGQQQWRFETDGILRTEPLVLASQLILIISYDKMAYLLDPKNKNLVTKIGLNSFGPAKPCEVTINGVTAILLCLLDHTVRCLSLPKLEERWRLQLQSPIFAPPVHSSNVAVVSSVIGQIMLVDLESGAKTAEINLQQNVFGRTFIIDELAIIATELGYISILDFSDLSNLRVLHTISAPDARFIQGPNKVEKTKTSIRIWQLDTTGRLFKFDVDLTKLQTSSVAWTLTTEGETFGQVAWFDDNTVILGTRANKLQRSALR